MKRWTICLLVCWHAFGMQVSVQIPLKTGFTHVPETDVPEDSSAKTRIEDWIRWKNQHPRYDFHFNSLPNRLMPENQKYAEGLYMRGFLFYVIASVYVLGLVLFLVVRLRFRIWGGQTVKSDYFTFSRRYAPGVLCALGFFAFVSGGTVLLIGSGEAHTHILQGLAATEDTAFLTSQVLAQMKHELVTMNMEHSGDFPIFRLDPGFLVGPQENALSVLRDSDDLGSSAAAWEQKRLVLTLVLFCLGFVLFLVALLGFVLKVESLLFCFGISQSVLGIFATLLFGIYLAETVGSGDYCEAVLKCVYSDGVPKEAKGLGFYFRDFNSTSRISLLTGEHEMQIAYTRAIEELNSRLRYLYNSPPVSTREELTALFSDSEKDASTKRWALTSRVLDAALAVRVIQDVEVFRRGRHVTKYCRDVEEQVCGQVMDDLYLGFVGLVIVSAGCGLAVCGGFAAPRVIERWKKEDLQTQLGKFNLYGM